MKLHDYLQHHEIARNPFAEEDAQTDPVFKEYCIANTYHSAWDKVYGDPQEPSTAIVFGEKGSGKTALRLQIARHLQYYNQQHPERRLLIVHYDDFNPFLDRFRQRLPQRKRKADRVLAEWKLWDHMDAILSLAVTGIVDRLLGVRQPSTAVSADVDAADADRLDHHQARDLLLLAACYDVSLVETFKERWHRLRQRLGFRVWRAHWDLGLGSLVTLAAIALAILLGVYGRGAWATGYWYLFVLAVAAGWLPRLWHVLRCFGRARGLHRRLRTGVHDIKPLRQVLMHFRAAELAGQPLPDHDSTDARYELLMKLQNILDTLRFGGIMVLVDRVDEPHLINGSADLMRALVWPLLDNKFLKHPGLGVKLLLPIELTRFIEREGREFYQRARLDKQNMVTSFEWSPESLLDVMNARIRACAVEGREPRLRMLLSDAISDQRLLEALRALRLPRHAFKFMYRLLVAHCDAHTDDQPQWQISTETFESTLALYLRDQDAFDRGVGAG